MDLYINSCFQRYRRGIWTRIKEHLILRILLFTEDGVDRIASLRGSFILFVINIIEQKFNYVYVLYCEDFKRLKI